MPGDHTYDTPTIPIVVVWNGVNHYSPTYPITSNSVLQWKLSVIGKHLQEAISIFGEIESDIDDQNDFDLCEQFHMLRDTAVRSKHLLGASAVGIGQVAIPKPHLGPDPRDIQTSITRSTVLKEHPAQMVKGGMSRTLESIIDVAEATNPAIPLIPSIPETSVTQTHSGPIPSTYERSLFPPPPKALKTGLASKEKEFTLPIGQYMEVKRKMGGSDLPPISSQASAILAKEYVKTSDSRRERQSDSHREKASDSRLEKASDSRREKKASDSGRGKAYDSRDSRHSSKGKPKLIVSLPLHPGTQKPKPKHPPQAPPPPPPAAAAPVSSAASAIAAAFVSDLAAGNSSSSAGSTSKSRSSKGGVKGSTGKHVMKGKLQLIRCLECKYSTFNKGDFNLHMDKHRGIRYICPEEGCNKDFGSSKARDQHFRTVHLKRPRSECPYLDCDFSHNDHGVTKVHMYTNHGVGVEPKCRHPDCKDRDLFTNFRVFERHMKNYHQPKDALCPHCKKMYKGVDHLKVHIETAHKDKTSVQCDQCGRFYASYKSLKAHKEEHHKC